MMNQRTSPLVAGLVPLNGSWGRLSHAALGSRGWGWLEPLAAEAFLAVLRPEERASVSFASDFLEGFTGFASNSSLSDVLSPTRGEAFLRLFTPCPERPPSASQSATAFSFSNPWATALEWWLHDLIV
jgi:hypothetical protein